MAQNKTVETENSVEAYLNAIPNEKRRLDCHKIDKIFTETVGLAPKMWGPAIVGYGNYHYKYESGREGDAPLVGFSSRVEAITLYIGADFEQKDALLAQLGKHKASKGCVYIKKLEDVDQTVLSQMIRGCAEYMSKLYPS